MDRGNGREEIGEGYNLGPGEFKIPNNDETLCTGGQVPQLTCQWQVGWGT